MTPKEWDAQQGGIYRQRFSAELRRMNMQRRCRLYCVGIGEAAPAWLDLIAQIGRTKAAYFGPKTPAPAPLPGRPSPREPRRG
jgi:hypothetical protein